MDNGQYEGRVPGTRREKMKGYLKAANELRQTYQAQLSHRMQGEDNEDMPGTFPDIEIFRSGDEEMILFPSYARKHIKRRESKSDPHARDQPGTHENIQHHQTGDAEFWRQEWEKYEDANAIVDVDVRGWIYSPHKTPFNRKNRLLIAVARRLSGIPAPIASQAPSRDSSQHTPHRRGAEDLTARHEEEAAILEAENIARHGQKEADAAWRGRYSISNQGLGSSRSSSPVRGRDPEPGHISDDEDVGLKSIAKRYSWHEPTNMSPREISEANDVLMSRLKAFMTLPMASTTITVFFFNESKSRSKSVTTNDSGHFNVRAALGFVPTHVRVLASENLSATEEVIITEAKGVSLVSDIDDTIKHSAIAAGAREIFKNTFIKELGDLTIKGVKEWYNKMASMGVKMHYVSNSPWQLYPLLRTYFALAGLPHGSFHLKQYSGMLQGIFEPAAERKKGSLERIFGDFPERKFILVGDSGEADLEVYTEVVLANPGRVLGIFIRDVTTPTKQGFFDHSMSHHTSEHANSTRNGNHLRPPIDRHRSDLPSDRPNLPSRPKPDTEAEASQQEDLIDFSDDIDPKSQEVGKPPSYSSDLEQLDFSKRSNTLPPARPAKPSNLRQITVRPPTPEPSSVPHEEAPKDDAFLSPQNGEAKRPPPLPPKPRRPAISDGPSHSSTDVRVPFSSASQNQGDVSTSPTDISRPAPLTRTRTNPGQQATAGSSYFSSSPNEEGYLSSARRQLVSAYNSIPPLRSATSRENLSSTASDSTPAFTGAHSNVSQPPSQLRRGLTSYPAAAARFVTGATGGDPAAGGDGGALPGSSYNKKEEVWRRRWARAEDTMQKYGVVLRTWRVGEDVMDLCAKLVEREMRNSKASIKMDHEPELRAQERADRKSES